MELEVVHYPPAMDLLPAQTAFMAASERFVAFIGGVGSGKTMAGAIKVIQYVTDHPGALGLVGAPNKTVLRDVTQRTLLEMFARFAPNAIKLHKHSEGHIFLHNGSEIFLRSMDDFEHRRGTNLAFFWLDEGIYCGYEAWRVMKARLRQTGFPLQAFLTSTPRGQDQFYRDFEANLAPDHRLVRAATYDNYYLPDGYAASLGYTGSYALQELEGHFVAREGLVYHLRAENVAPTPPLGAMQTVIGGIDWGFRNPFHCNVYGIRDGTVYQMAEFRAVEANLERVVLPALVAFTQQYGVRVWYAGPDRPDNIAALAEKLRIGRLPCAVVAAQNPVLEGVETVRSLLECTPPRLIIDPACTFTLAEIADYRYPDDAASMSGEIAAVRDENPVKQQDHALDALRYAVHSHLGRARRHQIGEQLIAQLTQRMAYTNETTIPGQPP